MPRWDNEAIAQERSVAIMRRAVEWGDRKVPTGLRSVVGLLLMGAGVGIPAVLGFWMLPSEHHLSPSTFRRCGVGCWHG
jgi:hypothetical protein